MKWNNFLEILYFEDCSWPYPAWVWYWAIDQFFALPRPSSCTACAREHVPCQAIKHCFLAMKIRWILFHSKQILSLPAFWSRHQGARRQWDVTSIVEVFFCFWEEAWDVVIKKGKLVRNRSETESRFGHNVYSISHNCTHACHLTPIVNFQTSA